jgi:hypothetical protein
VLVHSALASSLCLMVNNNKICLLPLQDLPLDPTGELESLRSFIEENIDICKWVGIAVVVIQVCCSPF